VCGVGSGESEIVSLLTLKMDLLVRWLSCVVCSKNENHNFHCGATPI